MGTAIEATGLRKSYGEIEAVRGVDISIDAGETVALLGPNGAGKSTTIDMILGLADPDGGSVSVFGLAPSAAIDAGSIGAMLQTGALIRDLSVRELVEMVASLYPAPLPVAEALELTGLSEIAGQRTQKLSGGQTQRVRFAVALVSNPKLLVLDEPTVAMDVEGRHSFWTTMRELAAQGRTVLFATHYLEEADAYADRAVLMAHGKVVADGPTNEIKAMVGSRTIRATIPGADIDAMQALPGVSAAERRGEAVILSCTDSDAAIRALLEAHEEARDIEIVAAGLEQAFLQLTGDDAPSVPQIELRGGGPVNALPYTRFELLRTLRNRRFFILSLGFPLVLFFVIAGPQRNVHDFLKTGISAPLYYMVGMVAFGTMSAMLSCGARIAAERAVGWNRQLRISPLTTRSYFRAKVLTAYLMALLSMVVLYASGIALGVSLPVGEWLKMSLLILVGLAPLAALGITLGHLLTPESIGPAMGGGVSLLALLGGTWFPISGSGVIHDIAELLPSYWIVQASHIAIGGHPWPTKAWVVVIAWTLVLTALARRIYRRDTQRV